MSPTKRVVLGMALLVATPICVWVPCDGVALSWNALWHGSFKDDIFECSWTPHDRGILVSALRDADASKRNVAAYVLYRLRSEGTALTPGEIKALEHCENDPSPEARHYARAAVDDAPIGAR